MSNLIDARTFFLEFLETAMLAELLNGKVFLKLFYNYTSRKNIRIVDIM